MNKLLKGSSSSKSLGQEEKQPCKKTKLDADVITVDDIKTADSSSKPWLSAGQITLSEMDRNAITRGEMLNDNHINFAQELLKIQFKHLSGLCSTLLLAKKNRLQPATDAVQIIHTRGNDWIVASTIGCLPNEVMVFDSLYSSIDQPTLDLLKQLFGEDVKVKLEKCPQQTGVRDCGVFAVAVSTLLANLLQPSQSQFNQESMRDHLLECFESHCLKPFPCQ